MPSHPLAFFGMVFMFSGLMVQVVFMDPAATLPKLAFALSWIMIGCTMFVSGVLLGIADGRDARDRRISELTTHTDG